MDTTSITDRKLLDALNAEEVARLVPLVCYLTIILLTGLPGNLLVILVYRQNYHNSNSKMFVIWLAIIDLLNCIILILEIVNVVHQFNFPDEYLCKITIFITLWPTLVSGISLCAISYERYRKVCKPLAWQISNRIVKRLCLTIVGLSLLLSWPSLILFGLREVPIHSHNITGHECMFKNEYDDTASLKIYSGLLWITFVISLTVLVVFYFMIGRKVFAQLEKRRSQPSPSASFYSQTNVQQGSNNVVEDFLSTSSAFEMRQNREVYKVDSTAKLPISRQISTRQTQAKRSAFIMFIISLVFVISFIPHLVLRLIESMDKTFVSNMSNTGRVTYKFFLRSYFLNCASNPFIYCVCLPQFRNDARNIISRIWKR